MALPFAAMVVMGLQPGPRIPDTDLTLVFVVTSFGRLGRVWWRIREPRAPLLIGFIPSMLPERCLWLGMMTAVAPTASFVGVILVLGVGPKTNWPQGLLPRYLT